MGTEHRAAGFGPHSIGHQPLYPSGDLPVASPLNSPHPETNTPSHRSGRLDGFVQEESPSCGPSAATPALGERIALNERPRLRPARHPHRPSRAVARSPGLSKTSDRWWCPPRTRSEQCLESCNSRALRASGSRRPACGWTLEDRRNWPRVQRNGRWEMLWTLSVHNNSMGSVPIRSPNTIPFSGVYRSFCNFGKVS